MNNSSETFSLAIFKPRFALKQKKEKKEKSCLSERAYSMSMNKEMELMYSDNLNDSLSKNK